MTQTYDTSDREAVNRARAQAGRTEARRKNVVGALMENPEGRAWIYAKLEECHIWGSSFTPGAPDLTAFREGERNIGLRLLADVMAEAPAQYVTMVREAKAEEVRRTGAPAENEGVTLQ